MDSTLWILSGTAVLIAFAHTIMGPDHYLPFIMLGRANKWSAKKVAIISMLCGFCRPIGWLRTLSQSYPADFPKVWRFVRVSL